MADPTREAGLSDELATAWATVAAEVAGFEATMRSLPVVHRPDPLDLRRELAARFRFDEGVPVDRLTDELIALLRRGLVHVTHPRYYGLFNPSVRPAAVIGDTLAALFNPQLAVWSHAPAAQELERLTLARLARALGYDPEAMAAHFTSGGAEANLVATLAALAIRCPAAATGGLRALDRQPVLYLSSESHHSFVKVARMTGLGTDAVREVPLDGRFVIDPEALDRMMAADAARGLHPFMVVGTAGTTGTGMIDPLSALADVAARHRAWFHVDAAWGGAAVLSPALRPHLAGIERADSITWDAHKWLSVPMGAGMVFTRHPEAMERAFRVLSGYMPPATSAVTVDPHLVTPQWSRRATGLKVFCALAELGVGGFARLIDHQTAMADLLRRRLGEVDWIVVNDTPLPVVAFSHPDIRQGHVTTTAIRDAIYARGNAWISALPDACGEPALRACITSYLTTEQDIEALVEELEAVRR
jgi:glutamate/tyrosine decarboxylase-like PLP-dependent enzyme